jgi:cobalt/nickel transport system permease protein
VKKKNKTAAIFLGATFGDLVTYVTTAFQLSLAFPAANGGIFAAFIKFISIFGITQIPLAVIEGLFTVMIFKFVEKHSANELRVLEEVRG